MNQKFSAYGLFYVLALAFWALNMNLEQSTLLCVFYSIFIGTVWGLIPKVTGSEPLSWKFLLPPFMLVVLMMLSVKLKMVMSSDVVLFTAMSLLHFRASILSFTRLTKRARIFCWIQLGLFVSGLVFLFQKNFFSFTIPRSGFVMFMLGMSTLSIGVLLAIRGKKHEPNTNEANHSAISS